jgi:cyanophycinase
MNRRDVLLAGLGLLGAVGMPGQTLAVAGKSSAKQRSAPRTPGDLVIIGGAEDRKEDMFVLRRFVELTRRDAGPGRIALVTAASGFPGIVWERYENTFKTLGVQQLAHIEVRELEDGDNPDLISLIHQSQGIFITGGDQRRLMNLIGGTRVAQAIDAAYRTRGACVAGTSAGASALSASMLAGRSVGDGLGLLRGALIDQHFTQRGRLRRLVAAVAKSPRLIGIGVDEDTALVIRGGRDFEVVGAGAVTMVDGRALRAPLVDIDEDALAARPEIRIHLLAADTSPDRLPEGKMTPEERAMEKSARSAFQAALPSLDL